MCAGTALFFGDESGQATELKIGSIPPIKTMFFSASKDYLALLTSNCTLFAFRFSADGNVKLAKKMRLTVTGDVNLLKCAWVGGGLLAATNEQHMIRFWHVEKDINYQLSLKDKEIHASTEGEVLTCLDFNPQKRMIVCGTNSGRVIMWRRINAGADKDNNPESEWEPLAPIDTHGAVLDVGYELVCVCVCVFFKQFCCYIL